MSKKRKEPTKPPEGFTPIEGYPTYFVTAEGNIYRIWQDKEPRELKQKLDKNKYAQVSLKFKPEDGKVQTHIRKVHTIVISAFKGKNPGGMHCRHLDGDKLNNHKDNLKWGTPKENAEDRKKHHASLYGDTWV